MAKRIAIDFDEVLFPLFTEYTRYYQKKVNRPVKVPLKHPYCFGTAIGTSDDEAQEKLQEFFRSEEHRKLTPIAGSQRVIEKLKSDGWEMSLVTARPTTASHETEYLLEKFFPNVFQKFIYCNGHTSYYVPKYKVCEHLGAKWLIDDNYKHCLECLDVGMGVVNFVGNPVYPWCDETKISARNWDQVYDFIA